jgi:predicted dienelactone hydrolase
MTRCSRMCTLLMATLVVLAGCGLAPQAAQPTAPAPTPQPTAPAFTPQPTAPAATPLPTAIPPATATIEPPPTALAYGKDGPYAIGMRDVTIDGGSYKLPVTVFYPAVNGAPDTAHAPYPLIVFAVGLAGTVVEFSFILRTMASYGFVVISWNPRGESLAEFWAGAATRPLDTRLIISASDKLTAPDGPLAGLIDTRRIAVTGGSSGGWSALVGGGAQMDLGWCAAFPDRVAKFTLSNCAQFVPHQQDIAAMLGLKRAPTGLWPQITDPRVVAVLAASPDGDIWGAEYAGVRALQAPTLVLAGAHDTYNPPEWCAYPIYEHLGSKQKALVVFEHAGHDLGLWDIYAEANKHIWMAFLLAQLKGDPAAAKALLPENLTIPGVKYTTTGFSAAK